MRTIGVLEILGAVGLVVGIWSGLLGVAAAAGLTVLMVGALTFRWPACRVVHDIASGYVK